MLDELSASLFTISSLRSLRNLRVNPPRAHASWAARHGARAHLAAEQLPSPWDTESHIRDKPISHLPGDVMALCDITAAAQLLLMERYTFGDPELSTWLANVACGLDPMRFSTKLVDEADNGGRRYTVT